jgi:hypothetical protein
VKIEFFTSSFHKPDLDTPPKKLRGGHLKRFEKKNVFPKKYVELRTFDGKSGVKLPLEVFRKNF